MSSNTASLSTTPAGIPRAPFAEDPFLLIIHGDTLELTLRKMTELASKYRMMEESLQVKRERALAKLQELQQSIDAIELIQEHPSDQVEFEYELADTLYAHALITDKSRVSMYLGANTIMELSPKEAIDLLSGRVQDVQGVIKETDDVLFFLREQITTCEVSQARLYNLAMRERQQSERSSSNA